MLASAIWCWKLAGIAAASAAPEESELFDDTAQDYFEDPQALLAPRGRDEALGFGLDLTLLTPFVLAASTAVVQFLVSAMTEAAHDEARSTVAAQIRKLIRRSGPADASTPPPSVSPRLLKDIHRVSLERARQLGLDESRAVLLSDAIAGSFVAAS